MERDTAFAAVPRLRVNFYFVNEHDCFFRTEFFRREFVKLNSVNSVFSRKQKKRGVNLAWKIVRAGI
jgi:xylose isomerase